MEGVYPKSLVVDEQKLKDIAPLPYSRLLFGHHFVGDKSSSFAAGYHLDGTILAKSD